VWQEEKIKTAGLETSDPLEEEPAGCRRSDKKKSRQGAGDPIRGNMKEWFSRGYLPHRDKTGLVQHVTFHLADSIPQKSRDRLKLDMQILENELSKENADNKTRKHRIAVEKLKRIHELLDAGHGECHLRNPHYAKIVRDALLKFDGDRYNLKTWCIMPNHVHVLMGCNDVSEAKIVHSWKSYTALAINRELNRNGHFWHREYFDRFIRDKKHLALVIEYIEMNPVKAGLVKNREDWVFTGNFAMLEHIHLDNVAALGK
jgi:REP element-mobilizing transposase RayT